MANHGRCKNCWWWMSGRCYMKNSKDHPYTETKEYSYCPDYTNRSKEDTTLFDWIQKRNLW